MDTAIKFRATSIFKEAKFVKKIITKLISLTLTSQKALIIWAEEIISLIFSFFTSI